MNTTLTLLAALVRARTGHFLAISGLWLALCANSPALIPPNGTYYENTSTVPVEKTISEGGIRMKIETTIRLTPAPISAMHPFLKAIRLNNGDLLLNCPLSGGPHRDYDLSPKEDGDVCSLRSKDNGKTWQKSRSQTSEDGGKTWVSKPTVVRRGARLEDGSFLVDYGRHQCLKLDATADKQVVLERREPMSLQYGVSMVQLRDGRVLCAGQIDRLDMILKGRTFEKGCSYGLQFRTSADLGRTWQEAGQLSFQNFGIDLEKQGDNTMDGYGEPFLLRAANGDLLVFVRTVKFLRNGATGQRPKYPPVKVSRSRDEGKTWSQPIEVHPTGVMPVATLLDNGIIVAFTGRGGNRVAASRDNGLTWHCHHNVMFTGQSPNFSGHNAIVPVGGGRALLIYSHNHRHPDNKDGFTADNRYGAELIGTFVSFTDDELNLPVAEGPFPPPPAGAAAGGAPAARASSAWGRGYEADKACDGDETTRWGAAPESRSGWLEVDLGREKEIGRAVVMEIGFHRTEKFAIEVRDGEAWKPVVTGTSIAGRRAYDFEPVTARVFRLNILAANEVPTIEEFALLPPGAKAPESVEAAVREEAARAARLTWFDEAKYGLFINWGLYAIPAGEWKGKPVEGIGEWIMNRAKIPVKEYEQLAAQFNPGRFNADEWAQLAVDAGMKYVVYDCKHHDGFAMYRSRVSPYNVHDATPWKRDPFKELQEACAKRGLKFCFYYSQAQDWHEPDGAGNEWDFGPDSAKDFDRYLRGKALPQVRELLSTYGPIGLIWFDTPRLMTPERSKLLVDLVRSIQPDTLINSRLGPGGLHDYQSRGDNEIPHLVTPGAWETAATINDTWGYKKGDRQWKTPGDICFKLVDIVSKGGNYLLNVGPDADGVIPQPSQDILREVGAWLKVNGEAVYGAGRTPFGDELGSVLPGPKDRRGQPPFAPKTDWRCTTKPGRMYVHFFRWPGNAFELPQGVGRVSKSFLLADPERRPLGLTVRDGRTSIALPDAPPGPLATVICVETSPATP
jgi:alpha-L-fucosidase